MSLDSYTGYIPIVGSFVATIIAIGTIINRGLTKREEQQEEEILKLKEMVLEEQKRRIIHETQFNLFWDYWKQEAPKILMKPHTPEIDALLREMQYRDLTDEEKKEFVKHTEDIIDRNVEVPYVTDSQLGTYATLKARFRAELKTQQVVKHIDAQYEEQKRRLQEEYEEKKKNRRGRFAFWR